MPDIFTSHPDKKDEPEQKQPVQSPIQQPAQQNVESPPQQATEEKKQETVTEEHSPLVQKNEKKDAEHPAKEIVKTKPNNVSLFTHYCEKPKGINFVNQEPDEEVLLFLRRHFVTNVPWMLIAFFLLFLPVITFILFNASNFTLFSIPLSLIIILLGFYYLIVFNYALLNFITWFYDMGIISRKRLIDLDANNILHHHWAETDIADIVDVSVTQQGFFSSFFNFGNIHIQTEAVKANFEYVAVPMPTTASDIISDLKVWVINEEKKHE